MKFRNFLLCWLPVFIVMFAINGLFHGMLASEFFDKQLQPIQTVINPSEYTNMFWIILLEIVISFVMSYFILLPWREKISGKDAAIKGALINLVSASSWNFANASMFIAWSTMLSVVDMGWHIALGAFAGWLIAWTYNRFASKHSGI